MARQEYGVSSSHWKLDQTEVKKYNLFVKIAESH